MEGLATFAFPLGTVSAISSCDSHVASIEEREQVKDLDAISPMREACDSPP